MKKPRQRTEKLSEKQVLSTQGQDSDKQKQVLATRDREFSHEQNVTTLGRGFFDVQEILVSELASDPDR